MAMTLAELESRIAGCEWYNHHVPIKVGMQVRRRLVDYYGYMCDSTFVDRNGRKTLILLGSLPRGYPPVLQDQGNHTDRDYFKLAVDPLNPEWFTLHKTYVQAAEFCSIIKIEVLSAEAEAEIVDIQETIELENGG